MHRKHSPELKRKVAVEAMRGQLTTTEIAAKYQVRPCQVSRWKRQAEDGLQGMFDGGHGNDQAGGAGNRRNLSSGSTRRSGG